MNLLQYFLPDEQITSFKTPLITVLIGAVIKHVLGGSVFDLIGHFLIFVGCLNIVYVLSKGNEERLNFVVRFLLVGVIFLGVQIALIQLFNNWLDIKPFFATQS